MGKTSILDVHQKRFLALVLKQPYLLLPSISKFVGLAGQQLHAKKIVHRQFLGLHSYAFKFSAGVLKARDLQQPEFSLNNLIKLARAKFDWPIDPVQLGQSLMKVVTVKEMPTMPVPFERQKMEDFFLKLAKGLQREIFRG